MSRDYGEMEQAFLATLKADTGRDLAGWMALLDTQSFGHRNDMIDWLRQQGFPFSKASWLERIHHNGGRPVYGERPQPKIPEEPARVEIDPAPEAAAKPPTVEPSPRQSLSAPQPTELAVFLAKAKGYRPLAELLLRQIRTTVPATLTDVHDGMAMFAAPGVYGALALTAKDIRLGLDLGDQAPVGDLKRLRLAGTPANLTHTIVLNDARKIDWNLLQLIAKSHARVNT